MRNIQKMYFYVKLMILLKTTTKVQAKVTVCIYSTFIYFVPKIILNENQGVKQTTR